MILTYCGLWRICYIIVEYSSQHFNPRPFDISYRPREIALGRHGNNSCFTYIFINLSTNTICSFPTNFGCSIVSRDLCSTGPKTVFSLVTNALPLFSKYVQLELFLSAGTVCLSIYSLVAGIFGMNIPYTWNEHHGYMFKWVKSLALYASFYTNYCWSCSLYTNG